MENNNGREYAMYLINECKENVYNGSDRFEEINFTINCLEIVADREFSKKEWKSIYNLLNECIDKGDR